MTSEIKGNKIKLDFGVVILAQAITLIFGTYFGLSWWITWFPSLVLGAWIAVNIAILTVLSVIYVIIEHYKKKNDLDKAIDEALENGEVE